MIDAIPKDKAEKILEIVRNGMEKARKKKEQTVHTLQQNSAADELAKYAKLKEQGVLTEEEFIQLKKDLLRKISEAKGEEPKITDYKKYN